LKYLSLILSLFLATALSAKENAKTSTQTKQDAKYSLGNEYIFADLDFSAPVVISTSSLPGDTKVGTIVYQSSDNNFYGLQNASGAANWIALNAPSGGGYVPVGTVLPYGGSSAPTGYLLCNGAAVSRATYASLFAIIGTTFGTGDGSTTFNLPNTQGVFVRGAGSQTISSISYSGTLGTAQGDQFQGHFHGPTTVLHDSTARHPTDDGGTYAQGQSGAGNQGVTGPITDGTNGTPRTGAETRPANLSLNYIIKY